MAPTQKFLDRVDNVPANGVGVVGSVFTIPRKCSTKTGLSTNSNRDRTSSRMDGIKPLDHFIAGPENALAQVAADSVTNEWARFNPLFVSGPSGAGKSHLLYCLLNASQQAYPDLQSLSLPGSDFARAIADGFDVGAIDEVRETHRAVDILLVDGLHELDGKLPAQQELVHTIDCLVERHAQVVVTSRLQLDEFKSLLPALSSRLVSGLQVPIVAPSAITRQSILSELAKQHDLAIPKEISDRFSSYTNQQRSKPFLVQDLMAAIAEFKCAANAKDRDTATLVEEIAAKNNNDCDLTAKEINKRSAKYFNVTLKDLTGRSRRKTVVRARAVAVYLMRTQLKLSFQLIGQHLGGRDHTTTMHAFQRAEHWITSDASFARATTMVSKTLE